MIGAITGGLNFTEWKWVVRPEVAEQVNEAGEVIQQAAPALTLNYGNFLQVVFDFLIIALSIFMVVKGINNMKAKFEKPAEPEAPAAPAGPTQEELLAEIRDLLKNK